MTKEIRCNNTGCNCTEEERATNNGNCKHVRVVYIDTSEPMPTGETIKRMVTRVPLRAYLEVSIDNQKAAIIFQDEDGNEYIFQVEDYLNPGSTKNLSIAAI